MEPIEAGKYKVFFDAEICRWEASIIINVDGRRQFVIEGAEPGFQLFTQANVYRHLLSLEIKAKGGESKWAGI